MYLIIFPTVDEASIPFPCTYYQSTLDSSLLIVLDHESLSRNPSLLDEVLLYNSYEKQELPRRIHEEILSRLQQAYGQVEDTIMSDVINIIRQKQEEVFKSYRTSIVASLSQSNLEESSRQEDPLFTRFERLESMVVEPPLLEDENILPFTQDIEAGFSLEPAPQSTLIYNSGNSSGVLSQSQAVEEKNEFLINPNDVSQDWSKEFNLYWP